LKVSQQEKPHFIPVSADRCCQICWPPLAKLFAIVCLCWLFRYFKATLCSGSRRRRRCKIPGGNDSPLNMICMKRTADQNALCESTFISIPTFFIPLQRFYYFYQEDEKRIIFYTFFKIKFGNILTFLWIRIHFIRVYKFWSVVAIFMVCQVIQRVREDSTFTYTEINSYRKATIVTLILQYEISIWRW